MATIEGISVDEPHAALDEVDRKREAERLMVTILYKRGPSVPMIADRLDMRERTIFDVLDESRNVRSWTQLRTAIVRDDRQKIDEADRRTFEPAVNGPPAESGYDQPAWSTALGR